MDRITIEGIPSIDGEYEFDWSSLTMAEARIIKREAGVRFGEIDAALAAGDSDLLVAFALIALKRAGKDVAADLLWEAPLGKIMIEADEVEEETSLPPVQEPVSDASENGHIESSSLSFERRWGALPGDHEPEWFWSAWLGQLSIRPADMRDLTPGQLDGCIEFVQKRAKG